MRLTWNKQCLIVPVLALIIATTNNTAMAQNNAADDAARYNEVLSRYLAADTTFVGWLDVTQLDVHKAAEFLNTLGWPISAEYRAKTIKDAMVQLGVTRVYFVGNVGSLGQGPPVVLIPVKNESADAVAGILKAVTDDDGGITTTVAGRCVLMGRQMDIERRQQPVG
ncbi:MAG: hypothetical protein KDA89_10135, partial [Planctomycetaceae bacterium]|nr:hypothetical protein [Planctomycetaceae bacterium]